MVDQFAHRFVAQSIFVAYFGDIPYTERIDYIDEKINQENIHIYLTTISLSSF
jgi:hypothetical protein